MIAALPRDELLRAPRLGDAALQHAHRGARRASAAAPARSACTSAARPSTQRAHVGNARPFVLGMWLRELAAAPRLRRDARPQHHRRQRQDLRRGSGRERRARRARDRVVPRGHRRPRARHAGRSCRRRPRHPGDRRASSRSWSSAGSPTRSRATSTSASRATRTTGACPGSGPTRWSRAGAEPAEGGSARLRALEGEEAGRGHVVGRRRGGAAGPAGTSSAPRWPRRRSGRSFEIHGGGLDLVFPHHENELAQSSALGHEFARDLDAQRDARVRRREDVEVARQRASRSANVLDDVGERGRCSSSS